MKDLQTPALLSVHSLRKSYGEATVLTIDELRLYAGQSVLLSGINGAGKSTLLKIIAGLEKYDQGSLLYRGQPLSRRQLAALNQNIIYLHQQPFLFDASVSDNLAYGLRCRNTPRAERQHRTARALRWSGLESLADRNAKTLSGGEKQRLALARAWVLEPELLLLDEPTANMDTESREKTSFLVRQLINEGMAIVICSHDIRPDNRLIDRALVLKNGHIDEPATRTPSQTLSSAKPAATATDEGAGWRRPAAP